MHSVALHFQDDGTPKDRIKPIDEQLDVSSAGIILLFITADPDSDNTKMLF